MSFTLSPPIGPPFFFTSPFGQELKAKGQELPISVFTTNCATSSVTRRIPTKGAGSGASGGRSKLCSANSPGCTARALLASPLLSLCFPQPALSDSELAKEESYG